MMTGSVFHTLSDSCSEDYRRLLGCVKRSRAYRKLHNRFAGLQSPQPSETWNEKNLAYFVFDTMNKSIIERRIENYG